MKNLKDTAATVSSVARNFQAIVDMGVKLDELGDIEAAEASLRQQAATAQQNLDSVNVILATAKQQLVDTDALIDAAKAKAAGIVDDTNAQADAVITNAKTNAGLIIDQANTRAAAIDASIADKQTELNTVLSDIDTAQHNLDTLNGKIADARATIANLLK